MLPYYEVVLSRIQPATEGYTYTFEVYQFADDFSLVYVETRIVIALYDFVAYSTLTAEFPILPDSMRTSVFSGGVKVSAFHSYALNGMGFDYGSFESHGRFSSGIQGNFISKETIFLQTTSSDDGSLTITVHNRKYHYDFGHIVYGTEVEEWTHGGWASTKIFHSVVVDKQPTDCCLEALCNPSQYFYIGG
jgi:hypothetical protein